MVSFEEIVVDSPVVECDGGALGHPLNYLNMGDNHSISCPYCGRRFLLSDEGKRAPSHGH